MNGMTRWDPLRDVLSLSRLFSEPGRAAGLAEAGGWFPPVDIVEEGERIILRAEVPGLDRNDIEVNIENGTVTIRGEKKQEREVEGRNAYRMERFYGAFSRSFALPTGIEPDGIEATCRDGVLEIVLPKAREARPRRIPIASGDGQRESRGNGPQRDASRIDPESSPKRSARR